MPDVVQQKHKKPLDASKKKNEASLVTKPTLTKKTLKTKKNMYNKIL